MIPAGYENGYIVDVSLVTCRQMTAACAFEPWLSTWGAWPIDMAE